MDKTIGGMGTGAGFEEVCTFGTHRKVFPLAIVIISDIVRVMDDDKNRHS